MNRLRNLTLLRSLARASKVFEETENTAMNVTPIERRDIFKASAREVYSQSL